MHDQDIWLFDQFLNGMKHLHTKFQPNRGIRSGIMMDFDFPNHGLKQILKHQIFFINLDVPNG